MPDGVHDLDRLDAIGHRESHAVAALELEARGEVHAHHRDLAPQVAVARMHGAAARQRRQVAEFSGRSQQEMSNIHGGPVDRLLQAR